MEEYLIPHAPYSSGTSSSGWSRASSLLR
jgi:hypothetical protein